VKPTVRVLFLTEGRMTPSSRLRVASHLPALRAAGFEVKTLDVPRAPLARLARWIVFPRYDVIVIQKKLFRRWELWGLARKGSHLIYDFDDAVTIGPFGQAPRKDRTARFNATLARCDIVIAGNDNLASYAAGHPRVRVIPTGVDLAAYRVKTVCKAVLETKRDVVIGWIGTSGNLRYLDSLRPVFGALACQDIPFRLKVVCDKAPGGWPLPIDYAPWSLETEAEELVGFDVGIMPLDDGPWSRGKCGFKLLQYMASGLPAVSSPVGINQKIVQTGVNGFLADSVETWRDVLSRLVKNASLRERVGRAARRTVEDQFSLERCSAALVEVLHEVCNRLDPRRVIPSSTSRRSIFKKC
jgi:glycosyltransferase involved in cell wall biosynthesis